MYKNDWIKSYSFSTPVIVVGNLAVGGSGKTPTVIAICHHLKSLGLSPGVICKGYGGRSSRWPLVVNKDIDASVAGDEAVLLFQRCQCAVVAGPDRVANAQMLIDKLKCDVLIGDDGMQHYRLNSHKLIAVLDGKKRYGNGWCLPAGPLREPISALSRADWLISNGAGIGTEMTMYMKPHSVYNFGDDEQEMPISALYGKTFHAIAGIAHPQNFFDLLESVGANVIPHPFPDHHPMKFEDLQFDDDIKIIMTEKDAVKCQQFINHPAANNWLVLRLEAQLPKNFWSQLDDWISMYSTPQKLS